VRGDFVLDASVALALYLPATAAQKDYADKVVSLLINGALADVPALFAIETVSTLVKRSGGDSSTRHGWRWRWMIWTR
jgi:hypothetical protein